jgi:GNAT superfamily N-acetyltransferase
MVQAGEMLIRPKTPSDHDECLGLLRAVHARDGYPTRWPDDARRFVTPPYEQNAWVAVHDGQVVGHVALHADELDPALVPAYRATGLAPEKLAVVARLLVSPTARDLGIGSALLAQATMDAHLHGVRPVLDVAKHYAGAIAFYEACGWTRAGELTLDFPNGMTLESWLYVGPAPSV